MFHRRPEAPEAFGKLQKVPAAHNINFPAAFLAPRGSRGAPDAPKGPGGRKNNLWSFGKCFFGARSLALGPPVPKKIFRPQTSLFWCILQTGGPGGCEKQFSGLEKSFLGVQGLRKLETCFFGVRRLRRHAGSSEKAPAAHKINFPAAFAASRGSRGAPEAPKGPGGAQKQFFWP